LLGAQVISEYERIGRSDQDAPKRSLRSTATSETDRTSSIRW
jgi:hypothetical protein